MTTIKKPFMAKALIGLAAITFLSMNVMGRIKANSTETAFEPPTGLTVNPMEQMIVDGAAYFLESHGDFSRFLTVLESTAGEASDYTAMLKWLNRAGDNMEKANHVYFLLKETADAAPYDLEMVSRLRNFDYDRFAVENRLNTVIFKMVEDYLKKGDVRGIYTRILANTGEIAGMLAELRRQVEAGAFPGLPLTWKANQAYFESLMMGQYCAQVFFHLVGK
jgi:hypothetical protein